MKKIDIHVHTSKHYYSKASPVKYGDFKHYASPNQIIKMYESISVEKAIVLPIVSPECSFQISNEGAYAVTKKYPEMFLWFCCIDPRNGLNSETADLSMLIQHYKSLGAKGVGEITANIPITDLRVQNLFSHCQKNRMPILLHIAPSEGRGYGLIDELGLAGLEASLKRFPDLIFIGHSQPFWSEISRDLIESERNEFPNGKITDGRIVELLENYPNLYCDISANSGRNAFMRDPEYAYRFIERFADRLLYGTDICAVDNTHHLVFNDWLEKSHREKNISTKSFEMICYKNASKLLNLEL